jgi:hypothetical protein
VFPVTSELEKTRQDKTRHVRSTPRRTDWLTLTPTYPSEGWEPHRGGRKEKKGRKGGRVRQLGRRENGALCVVKIRSCGWSDVVGRCKCCGGPFCIHLQGIKGFLRLQDGGGRLFRNIGAYQYNCMSWHPRNCIFIVAGSTYLQVRMRPLRFHWNTTPISDHVWVSYAILCHTADYAVENETLFVASLRHKFINEGVIQGFSLSVRAVNPRTQRVP